jgi:hypothetical protein
MELGRRDGLLARVEEGAAELELDVHEARALVHDLDDNRAIDKEGEVYVRALARQWLAIARRCWFRQQRHILTRPRSESETPLTELTGAGPELATSEHVAELRRWQAAAVPLLHRPAVMPSRSGPELAALLSDVYQVSITTYLLEWHAAARPPLDQAEKAFVASVGHLTGITAAPIANVVTELWTWGKIEGSIMSSASDSIFHEKRQHALDHLNELAGFLSPRARDAVKGLAVKLGERTRAGGQ